MYEYDTTISIEKIVRDDLKDLKGEENYSDFLRQLMHYVTRSKKHYREWNDGEKDNSVIIHH